MLESNVFLVSIMDNIGLYNIVPCEVWIDYETLVVDEYFSMNYILDVNDVFDVRFFLELLRMNHGLHMIVSNFFY